MVCSTSRDTLSDRPEVKDTPRSTVGHRAATLLLRRDEPIQAHRARPEDPDQGDPRQQHLTPPPGTDNPSRGPEDPCPGYDWDAYCAARERLFARLRSQAVQHAIAVEVPDR